MTNDWLALSLCLTMFVSSCAQESEPTITGEWQCSSSQTSGPMTQTITSTDTYASDGQLSSIATMSMEIMNHVTEFKILTSGNWSRNEDKLTITLETADLGSAKSGDSTVNTATAANLENLIRSQLEQNGKVSQVFEIAELTSKSLKLGSSVENPDITCSR